MSRLRSLTALAGATALLGCASVAPDRPAPPPAPFVKAVQTVRHGMDAEAHYRTGRYFQGQARLELAADAYRRALAEQPSHVDALNALGIVHSLQQRPELAEQAFRLALQADPLAAHVHNNLGYHLMRNGRGAKALVAFERARDLDPGNADTQSNLASARTQMGLPGEPAMAAAAPPAPAAPPAAAQVPATTPAPATTLMGAAAPAQRVEVSNGNGTAGLARRVGGLLASASTLRPRLTNDKPYGVQASRIQYVAGAERLAQDINARLPSPLPLARAEALERDVRVRVLLGKDFPPGPSTAGLPAGRDS